MKKVLTYKLRTLLLMLTATVAFTACHNDDEMMQYTINATMEQWQSDSKVTLVNESWVYWQYNDEISIGSDQSDPSTQNIGWLYGGGAGDWEKFNGVFLTTLPAGSKYFMGLHPISDKNWISYNDNKKFHPAKIELKQTQTWQCDTTFDRQVLPMVATFGGEWDSEEHAPNLNFRTLASLVRLQFYNISGSDDAIKSVQVESIDASDNPDKMLCGVFTVDSQHTADPHLKSPTDASNSLLIQHADGGNIEFNINDLRTFYIVLPAYAGENLSTQYRLRVTVTNAADKSFSRTMNVKTRRRGITFVPAIGIESFESNGTTEIGLSGVGSKIRPFKIYTIDDLNYLRNCFNSASPGEARVNGQLVTGDTWFRIMRSDITLTDANWTDGISNFKGHMTYYSDATHVTHGITNQSCRPLFNNILSDGHVKGLAIITDSDLDYNTNGDGTDYSPLCNINYGTIEDCRNISPSGVSDENKYFRGKVGQNSCYAGICVENHGTIVGCDCTVARIFANGSRFAGICYTNQGTLSASVLAAPASIIGAVSAGGICYTNQGVVADCYCEISYNNTASGSTDWGGIVYRNTTGSAHIVRNCYLSASSIIRTQGNVGGIVCENDGVVDYCRNECSSLLGSTVGGIVATLSGGEVRNCFINDSALYISLYPAGGTHSAGGIAATQSGGTISNCYCLLRHFSVSSTDATGVYGTIVGRITGPTATVNNCYALEVDAATPQFYGSKTAGTLTHCHLVGGTQNDVNSINPVTNAALGTLLSDLTTNKPANGNSWTRGTLSGNDTFDKNRAPSLLPPGTI